MGLVDLKDMIDKTETDFYGKIYSYAFKNISKIQLIAENSWSNAGFYFMLCGNSLNEESIIWWGKRTPAWPGAAPMMSQMRVYVPTGIFYKAYMNKCPNCNDVFRIPDSKRGNDVKVAIGKAICNAINKLNGLRMTIGYNVETLLDVGSVEELLVDADLKA